MSFVEKYFSKIDNQWKFAARKALLVVICTLIPYIPIAALSFFIFDNWTSFNTPAVYSFVFLFFFLTGLFKVILEMLELKIKTE
ncbi:MAG: hypothetical protein ACTSP4_12680 [Candidatus Hodarchaeales archaeon]